MQRKIGFRYRKLVFALFMSCSTALLISGLIIGMHSTSGALFLNAWIPAFFTTWPMVFVVILVMAPLVNNFIDLFVEGE